MTIKQKIALAAELKNGPKHNGASPNGNGIWFKSSKAGRPQIEYASNKGLFLRADCLRLLDGIKDNSIDLVFVDPPFNLGKEYEQGHYNDSMGIEVYRTWCHEWLLELIRVLRPGGALFLYHWPHWLMQLGAWMMTMPNIQYKSWIALKMKSGFPIKGRLHPAHYGILYFVKRGEKATFNLVRHRTPTCRHCGKMTRDYGGYRKKFERFEDEGGIPWIQISDFWEDTRPARQDKMRGNTINELPVHIPERAILMASNPGDVVLDIFGGSGSTYQASQIHDRLWIGCELGDSEPTLKRLASFSQEKIAQPSARIRGCFKNNAWESLAEVVDYDALTEALTRIVPAPHLFEVYDETLSKSKVLGF